MSTPNPPPSITDPSHTPFTPINILLLLALAILTYYKLRPPPPPSLPKPSSPILFKTYTPPTLLPHNGIDHPSIFLAVRGNVYDVTPGSNFYGPGGPYHNFAGRDASRGLALGSFEEDVLTSDLKGPLDTLGGLDEEQKEALDGWEERFREKYLCVGRLVAVGEEGKKGEGDEVEVEGDE
ncbi:MAG: hypothetical protein M1824_004188 [Vezdaea acicularis]|nr:MAG: hypothetical protein M1824_004188 [Vezdaea acicularis]